MRPRAAFVPVVLAAVLVGGAVALVAPTGASTTQAPVPTLTTPVLSVRRIAAGLLDLRAETILKTTIDSALQTPTLGSAQPCVVVTSGGKTLYSTKPDVQLLPASTMKLLTATAALSVLGPDHRFTTTLRANSPPAGGTVTGDLWLVGGGDPILQTGAYNATLGDERDIFTHIESLADDVVRAGVKAITGSIVGDESRYDKQRFIPTWKPQYVTDGESGPLSALMVNHGMNPKPVADPALFAAQTFTALLQARGVTVAGPATTGAAPARAATVASIQSSQLRDVVGELLRVSDNTTAELLVKEIGLAVSKQGSTSAGTAAVRSALSKAGLDVSGLVNVDGSGLDRSDRVTCALLAAVVAQAGRHSILADDLPISGATGTLRKRLVGTPAAGRVLAKTGSLDDVSALAGWVDPKPGTIAPPLLFAFVANGLPNRSVGPSVGDKVSLAMASWPDVPPASTVVPLPVGAAR